MTLNTPTSALEIFNRIATDIITELNDLDPYLRASLIRAISVADSNAFFELYKTLNQLELLTFWDTTTGDSLERWAAIFGLTRNPATKATGFVTFTGIAGSNIALGSQFSSESGDLYETLIAGQITNNVISVDAITRVSSTATVTTASNHGLASNIQVTIAGAVETEYNGTFVITVTGLDTFEYTVTGTPTTPATGTITTDSDNDNIQCESIEFGATQNLDSGTEVSLASPIAGVDNAAFVSFDEIAGGTDLESDDSLRDRFLFRIQNPIALFNESAIIDQARTVSGVTRVFVQSVDTLSDTVTASSLTRSGDFTLFTTASPHGLFDGQPISVDGAAQSEYNISNEKILIVSGTEFGYVVSGAPTTPATGTIVASFGVAGIGQVRVFFVRDNDVSIIPTGTEIDYVRDALLEIKPAPMSGSDLFVEAPIAVVVPFTFTELTPNTTAMQTEITANLTSFFATSTSVAQDVTKLDYESVINSTLDSGGNRVESFTLSTPTTDIAIDVSELALIGTITYP